MQFETSKAVMQTAQVQSKA